jgi:hypothetical protein
LDDIFPTLTLSSISRFTMNLMCACTFIHASHWVIIRRS